MTQALHELWESALGRLSSKVSPQNYDMWLRPIEFVSDDAGTLQLRAPNSYVRLWFESNYLEAILDEIRTVSGVPIRVEFAADEAHRGPPIASIVVEDSTPAPAAAPPAPVEVDSHPRRPCSSRRRGCS